MTTKLNAMYAVAAFATLFYVGCGDDDSNVSPGSGGSGTVSGGKSGSGGGTTTAGGKASGGETGTSGGATGKGGATTAQGGAGGETVTPEGGTTSTGGTGPITPEGGSGGVGGSGPVDPGLPPCTTVDATLKCFSECAPNTSANSEQFLNHCGAPGVLCTPFTTPLSKLNSDGSLPPLP